MFVQASKIHVFLFFCRIGIEYDADTRKMLEIAQQLTRCREQQKITFANKLQYTEEWLQQTTTEIGEYNTILTMLLNFKENNPTTNITAFLQELGIDIK